MTDPPGLWVATLDLRLRARDDAQRRFLHPPLSEYDRRQAVMASLAAKLALRG